MAIERTFSMIKPDATKRNLTGAITKVFEDNGLRISGQFHSDQWGDFRAFFRFHLATDGRITRLEIGQAS